MSSPVSRRTFLKTTAAVGAVLTARSFPTPFAARAQRTIGANDKIRVGFIGFGGRARQTGAAFLMQPDVVPVVVCDCHRGHAEQAARAMGSNVEVCTDFRRLLDRKDIDAVSISTPDHWHVLPSIMACQAGKDVYVEKPLSRTVEEGRALVKAARFYQRVVQAGTQCRSAPHFDRARDVIQSGQLGRIHRASAWIASNWGPDGIGTPADSAPPDGLDWEMWQGPAARHPYNVSRFERFRQFWDYAGGTATDRGVHLLDIVLMCLGVESPSSVVSSGGRYVYKDNANTPDTQEILYEVQRSGQPLLMTWDHREANSRPTIEGKGLGMAFYGSQGTLVADYRGFVVYPEGKREPALQEQGDLDDGKHVRNFLDCMRSRQRPVADVELCHRSTVLTLIGNIAFRLGRKLRWDGAREQFIDDREANRMLQAKYTKPWKLPKI